MAGIRPLLRKLRYAPERFWHPRRRRAALARLKARGRPRTVLFICHGNICRSPYAAYFFAKSLNGKGSIQVASAGFIGPNRGCPANALQVASERGVDMSAHRSALISASRLSADLIVVMDAKQRWRLEYEYGVSRQRILVLGDLDPEPIERRTIRDPVEQPPEVFEAVYDRIDRCVRALVALI